MKGSCFSRLPHGIDVPDLYPLGPMHYPASMIIYPQLYYIPRPSPLPTVYAVQATQGSGCTPDGSFMVHAEST
jgi:hypothetical protein